MEKAIFWIIGVVVVGAILGALGGVLGAVFGPGGGERDDGETVGDDAATPPGEEPPAPNGPPIWPRRAMWAFLAFTLVMLIIYPVDRHQYMRPTGRELVDAFNRSGNYVSRFFIQPARSGPIDADFSVWDAVKGTPDEIYYVHVYDAFNAEHLEALLAHYKQRAHDERVLWSIPWWPSTVPKWLLVGLGLLGALLAHLSPRIVARLRAG